MAEKEKKQLPDGTRRVIFAVIDAFKMNAPIFKQDGEPLGKTGKGAKITVDNERIKKLQIPEAMISGNGLTMPENKILLGDLKKIEVDEVHTFEQQKENGYWRLKRVRVGEHGSQGLFNEDGSPFGRGSSGSASGRSGGYDPSGPIIGKLENWAMDFAQRHAPKGSDINDVLELALEALREANGKLVEKINKAATELYKVGYQGEGTKPTPKKDEEEEEETKPKRKPKPEPEEDEEEEVEEKKPAPKKRRRRTKAEIEEAKRKEEEAKRQAEEEEEPEEEEYEEDDSDRDDGEDFDDDIPWS